MFHVKQFARTRTSLLLGFAVLAFTGAAGPVTCSQQAADQVAVIEAKVAAFIAKAKTNAPIYLADAKAAAGLACSLIPVAQQIAAAVQSNVSGLSDKAQTVLIQADAYANKGNAACSKFGQTLDANVTPSDAVNTAIAAWNAYQAAKGQISAAQAVVAAGK